MIIAGFGAALLPFAFCPVVFVTLSCLAVAGLLWGPFGSISLTLFQDRTPPQMLSTILTARHATLITATPLGAAAGRPLVAATETPLRVHRIRACNDRAVGDSNSDPHRPNNPSQIAVTMFRNVLRFRSKDLT